MIVVKLLLYPFSLLYASAVWLRNRLYDRKWLKSTFFNRPVIVIGNLLVGGTGKSPMTEYLIRLLASRYRVATLSRGYGRRTTGFYEVQTTHTADEVGDEPLQFKRKFEQITVAVCENRVAGVNLLLKNHDVILLDDAFQHRALTPGLSLLLFDYGSLQKPKWLLPAGSYRDLFSERYRADVLIISKSPAIINPAQRQQLFDILSPAARQPVFFSTLEYGLPSALALPRSGQTIGLDKDTHVLLVTGIANPQPLYQHLKQRVAAVDHLSYKDHHRFSENDIKNILRRFHSLTATNKILLTTEKDAQRLYDPAFIPLFSNIPFYYMGIQSAFNPADGEKLDKLVIDYCEHSIKSNKAG